jgi:AraC-like DNA-binding protein
MPAGFGHAGFFTPPFTETHRPVLLSMPNSATVMAAFVKTRFESMVQYGACPRELVRRAGFDPRAIHDPDQRIPLEQEFLLWKAGRELIGDPAFALRIGAASDPRRMGVVGSLALTSPTLRDAGRQFARYARLINDRMDMVEREENGIYTCTYRPECPPEFESDSVELFFSTAITLCRTLVRTDIVPLEMRFRYPEPDHAAEYARLFRCPLRFGQADNAMVFGSGYQDLPVSHHDAYAHSVLTRHASALLKEINPDDGLIGKVRRYILANLQSATVNIDRCAASLHMSRRTLHRRLDAHGMSFVALLEEIRRELASDYLLKSGFSTGEIGFLLGYSESSAFHRAFKRWTGQSPSAFRDAHGSRSMP